MVNIFVYFHISFLDIETNSKKYVIFNTQNLQESYVNISKTSYFFLLKISKYF